jgi:hypothetical protein
MRERGKRCSRVVFLILLSTKTPTFFSLFLDFLAHKRLHKHPLIDNEIIHHKTLSLQTKSLTQILKIEKNYNKIISLQIN